MFRALLTTALVALSTPALADDILAPAPVTAATVYPDGALVTRSIALDLPAGHHRIMIPLEGIDLDEMPQIEPPAGLTIGAISLAPGTGQDPSGLFTPAQAAAHARLEAANDQVQAQRDRIATAEADLSALKARLGFVTAIRPPEGAADPSALIALADLVQAQSAEVTAAIEAAAKALRPLHEDLDALEQEQVAAQAAFDLLEPPGSDGELVVIEVIAPAPIQTALEFKTPIWEAAWSPFYQLHQAQDGSLMLDRKVGLKVEGIWTDVALTLSTVAPDGQVAPTALYPDRARIHEPREPELRLERGMAPMAEAMVEPEIIVEDAAPRINASANFDGVAVTYDYPDQVTIAGFALLSLDQIPLSGSTEIHATPERDDTAFMVALVTNDSAEPLLSGQMQIYREGQYLGDADFPLIPAGGKATLPLGPVEGLRLKHIVARNETGDTGFVTKSNTRSQSMRFVVENLTGEAQELTAFYPLPFSEQEDLTVSLNVSPRPDRRNVDDKRGVAAWGMRLAPGASQEVSVTAEFNWPEGWELNWYP